MSKWPKEPTLFQGSRATDDRGSLAFINGFDISSFKRFYIVENHSSNFIRAWHGHIKEAKAILVIKGTAIVCAVKMDDPISPNKSNQVERKVMSSSNPAAFYIPAGYANGFMTLSHDTQILVFSSTTLEESQGDDYRFEFNYWNPWEIVPR
jgi:dTDP-4-dehydrorhamnose 3,5-epimerase